MEMEIKKNEKKQNIANKIAWILHRCICICSMRNLLKAPVLILVLQLILQNDNVEQCWENEKLFDCDSVVGRENHLTEIFLADFDFHEK